jgi:predicted RNase H-like nuclease (RuvC/YqgF family)
MSSEDEIDDDSVEESIQEISDDEDGARAPLTEQQVRDKINEPKKCSSRENRAGEEIKATEQEIRDIKKQVADLEAKMSAICIAGRSQYPKGAVQLDFAARIKELDQENAMEEDEENFNPDEDIRYYDHVARSCVGVLRKMHLFVASAPSN